MSLRHENDSTLPSRAKRRPHNKSRGGCALCKQRRVKCDEARPVCHNCLKWKTSCRYKAQPSSTSSPSNADSGEDHPKAPGRPRNPYYLSELSTHSGFEQVSTSKSPSNPCASPPGQDFSLDLADLELLHQYYTSTSTSLSPDETAQLMYRKTIPQMAFSYPFVLHLLLALAGQHMHHLGLTSKLVTEQDHLTILAEKHFSSAVPQVKLILSELTSDNAQVAYHSSVLICMYILARGPMPGDYLVFNENRSPLWTSLLHGVRSIGSTVEHLCSDTSIPAGDDNTPTPNMDTPTITTFNLPKLHWQNVFQDMEEYILANVEPEFKEHYSAALNELSSHFEATYGNDDESSSQGDSLRQFIFRWLYVLHDQMVRKMQKKEPLAMIMLGYYAVLLRVVELTGCWFAEGWSHHILKGVYEILEDRYHRWLKWPFESVGLEWPITE